MISKKTLKVWEGIGKHMADKLIKQDAHLWRNIVRLFDSDKMLPPKAYVDNAVRLHWSDEHKFFSVLVIKDKVLDATFHEKSVDNVRAVEFDGPDPIRELREFVQEHFPAKLEQLSLALESDETTD